MQLIQDLQSLIPAFRAWGSEIKRFSFDLRSNYHGLVAEITYWNHFDTEDPMDWLEIRSHALENLFHDTIGRWICERIGHDAQVEDGVVGEYEEQPDDGLDHGPRKLIDINCGYVSWYCPRCGCGGDSYF